MLLLRIFYEIYARQIEPMVLNVYLEIIPSGNGDGYIENSAFVVFPWTLINEQLYLITPKVFLNVIYIFCYPSEFPFRERKKLHVPPQSGRHLRHVPHMRNGLIFTMRLKRLFFDRLKRR